MSIVPLVGSNAVTRQTYLRNVCEPYAQNVESIGLRADSQTIHTQWGSDSHEGSDSQTVLSVYHLHEHRTLPVVKPLELEFTKELMPASPQCELVPCSHA